MSASSHARRLSRTKKLLIVGGTVGALGAGGAAYAYWTTTGSGTGSATSTTPNAVTVTQTSTITALNPGKPAQTLSGTFSLPANSGSAYVTSLSVAITSVTKASGAATGTCDATDYTLGGTATGVGVEVTDSATKSWSGLTIAFNDKATNQDQCKGATVNLAYTTS